MLMPKAHVCFCAVALGLLAFPWFLTAQEPIAVSEFEGLIHQGYSRSGLIHSATVRAGYLSGVTLQIIVNEHGKVVSAKGIAGPQQFFTKAEEIELKRTLTPFIKDGKPVRASLKDTVLIVPAERWLQPRVPFPQVKDWTSVKVHLERGNCRRCVSYSVDIRGDGEVEFDGNPGMMIPGHHHARISQQAVRDLVGAFEQADYFSLLNEYVHEVSDSRRAATELAFDGHSKSMLDYDGLDWGIPDAARVLEDAIDRIAETEKWTKGNAQTGPSLIAENWNFPAITDDNRALFTNAAAHGLNDLVELCLGRCGQLNPLWSCSLEGAAEGGDLQFVRRLLQKGISPNNPPCAPDRDTTVLMNAAQCGSGPGNPQVRSERK